MIFNVHLSIDRNLSNCISPFINGYNDLLDTTEEKVINDSFIKKVLSLQDKDIEFLHLLKVFINNNTNFHSYHIFFIDIESQVNDNSSLSITMALGLPIVIYNNETDCFEFKHLRYNSIFQMKEFFTMNEDVIPVEIINIYKKYYQ